MGKQECHEDARQEEETKAGLRIPRITYEMCKHYKHGNEKKS